MRKASGRAAQQPSLARSNPPREAEVRAGAITVMASDGGPACAEGDGAITRPSHS